MHFSVNLYNVRTSTSFPSKIDSLRSMNFTFLSPGTMYASLTESTIKPKYLLQLEGIYEHLLNDWV